MDTAPLVPQNTQAEEEPRSICTNCGKKMAKKGKFCPHCGQKRFEGKIPLKELSSKFVYKVTNLDGKLLRMMWRLFIPGQVTIDYFAGKIKQYPHPFQFFFVVMFFFLIAFNKSTNGGREGINFNLSSEDTNIRLSDGGAQTTQSKKRSNFFYILERHVFGQEIIQSFDSLPSPLRTPDVKKSLELVVDKINKPWLGEMDSLFTDPAFKDSLSLNFVNKVQKVAHRDIVEYTPDEIIAKYQVTDWIGRTLIKQGIRSVQNPDDLIAAYIGSFSWTILAIIIAMAGAMYCFYWRQKRYYVEHFVLLLHWHSGVFLALTLLIGLDYILPLGFLWAYVGIAILVFLWLTMWRFYGQHWFWTSLKWFSFILIYTLGFAVFFVLGLLAVFTFF